MIISVDSKSRNFNWSEFLAPAGAKTGYCQNLRSNGAVLSFIVFSTLHNYLRIFEIKVDYSSLALRFFRNTTVKENVET